MSLKNLLIVILITFNLLISYSYSHTLSDKITEILFSEKEINKSLVGIKIYDLDKNKNLYSYNSNNYFIPASNMKIITTLLALEYLGKDFKFETKLKTDYFDKDFINNLYLELSSDPLFSNKDLDNMIKSLKEKGINNIKGNLFIYNNKIDNEVYGRGWMYDDLGECYSSQVGKYIIDKNCLSIRITGDLNIETNNLVNFVTQPYEDDFKIFDFDIDNLNIIYGGKPIKNYYYEISINNPQKYLEKVLLKKLDKYNINFNGKIFYRSDNKDYINLYTHKSISLQEILKIFNKESDNLIGEILLKTISHVVNKKEGNTEEAINIAKNYIKNEFDFINFRIVDGSGLSRYNLLSPYIIIEVLKKIYFSEYKEIVFNAFPIGGLEGTLKNRLKNINKSFKVIAKSGSMTSVNCLSGYILSENKNIAFSIMINNSLKTSKELRDFQDKIIENIIINFL
ncbi:MAG: hypothetical protein KatS3mg068_1018 [Candidatus Sericytochromatia bacterium]|nr:MAG: hypothetical protein KatS3mg068_1018 [Candidatus Sericytochromatia bacterium]